MKGTIKAPGIIRAINDREYRFYGQNQRFNPGDEVEFVPQGTNATEIKRVRSSTRPRTGLHHIQGQKNTAQDPMTDLQRKLNSIPYAFVPVVPELSVTDTPVFHDGANSNKEQRLSGEFRISFETLTPLLAGNYRYQVKDLEKQLQEELDRNLQEEFGDDFSVDKGKAILEPLRDQMGRVLIGGSGLTGMLRHQLGALLSAPMERVDERTYSYRPNAGHADTGNEKYVARAAVVAKYDVNEEESVYKVMVGILENGRKLAFVPNHSLASIKKSLIGQKVPAGTTVPGIRLSWRARKQSWRVDADNESSWTFHSDWVCCRYAGGIDGTGCLAAAAKKGLPTYHWILVEKSYLEEKMAAAISTKTNTIKHYIKTQSHLADTNYGHLKDCHPLSGAKFSKGKNTSKFIRKKCGKDSDGPHSEEPRIDFNKVSRLISHATRLTKGDIIYVEQTTGKSRQVTSFGHNHHYRQRYSSTVRTRWNPKTDKYETRPILKPLADEQGSKPRKLSGARLLFGYVATRGEDSGAYAIGRDDYERLAGRLAFNIASEQSPTDHDDIRFLNEGKAVPLKVLGMPRPSAVEFYLDQKNRQGERLVTYGDLPEDEGGELRGRKFYRHQAAVTFDHIKADREAAKGNQASLARFVSKPGRRFRVSLRFRDLRPWELGAVLLVLEPWRIKDLDGLPDALSQFKDIATEQSTEPAFAHKLGYGQPLGMGSVHIKVDEIHCWGDEGLRRIFHVANEERPQDSNGDLIARCAEALGRKLKGLWNDPRGVEVLRSWFDVHRYRGTPILDYPRNGKGEIFGWHTEQRRAHAKARRERNLNPQDHN